MEGPGLTARMRTALLAILLALAASLLLPVAAALPPMEGYTVCAGGLGFEVCGSTPWD